MTPSFLPCGDGALTLQLGDEIDAEINARIIGLADGLEAAKIPGVREIVPTYRSLLVQYDSDRIRGPELERILLGICTVVSDQPKGTRRWEIPVIYGGEVGQDFDDLAEMKGLTGDELIKIHSDAEYRIYMIGFAPGFAYLGGVPEILHTPRLEKPRQNIPAGAIGIGGQQGNISSLPGPSGWRYIGWTPVRSFDPSRPEPFLFKAGDLIRFCPKTVSEGKELAQRVAAGETIVSAGVVS